MIISLVGSAHGFVQKPAKVLFNFVVYPSGQHTLRVTQQMLEQKTRGGCRIYRHRRLVRDTAGGIRHRCSQSEPSGEDRQEARPEARP